MNLESDGHIFGDRKRFNKCPPIKRFAVFLSEISRSSFSVIDVLFFTYMKDNPQNSHAATLDFCYLAALLLQ